MYGDLATKLILESKRARKLRQSLNKNGKTIEAVVPEYQEEMVNKILKETEQLNSNAVFLQNSTQQNDKIKTCQYFVTLLSMERNKRCLLGYHKDRSDLIGEILWDKTNSSGSGFDINNLNHEEQQYMKEYSQLMSSLNGDFAEVDLTGSLLPPSEVFIDVRVLKDAGEIQTEYGVFHLIKDSQFFVRQSDVERLIQQGYLQKI
ncbi:hypothetical protein ACO0QE_004152 [Hanseniaspora vineae]